MGAMELRTLLPATPQSPSMQFRFSLLAALLAAFLRFSAAAVVPESEREEAEELERIIGGRPADPGRFPYAVALHYNNQFICTASILSPNVVMTAAHCVVFNGVPQSAEFFSAIANVRRSEPNYRIEFSSVIPHEGYSEQTLDNDIALLLTNVPIPLMEKEIGQVCIAAPETTATQYKNATAMGWGNTSPIRFINLIPENLQFVEQKIVSNTKCSFVNGAITENKLCATGLFTGICQGDSGGPLVHLSTDQPPVEIGIASYLNGLTGCGKLVPAVWTRVASYYDWIMQNAGDGSICAV